MFSSPSLLLPAYPPSSRTSAWGNNARSSPTYSPANAPPRQQQQPHTGRPAPPPAFPPLAQNPPAPSSPAPASRDRVLQSLSGLTGTTVTLVTKTALRYEGVVASTASTEGDTTGVTLKDVKDVSNPGAPLKDSLFIAATSIETYTSGPADARPTNGDSFRTDIDISAKKGLPRERDLQAWVPATGDPVALTGDDETFGPSSGNTSWDQFTVNEQLFGVKASFDENVYTTPLDRSAPDYKERERKAQKIANEILGTTTNNPHIAEERGLVDDSGVNEEDKYGAVVRGQNAYVPPGARRPQPAGSVPAATTTVAPSEAKAEVPKVAVNGPDGATVSAKAQSPPSSKGASPAPPAGAIKPPADALPAFRDFVKDEKQRLTQKRQALFKNEVDKRMADLIKFSQSFKLNKPIPDDLVPILAKDEEKQKQIKEKAKQDALDAKARAIGASTPTVSSRGVGVGITAAPSARELLLPVPTPRRRANQARRPSSAAQLAALKAAAAATPGPKKISMFIPQIPPFKGGSKPRTFSGGVTSAGAGTGSNANANGAATKNGTLNTNVNKVASPVSPNTAAAQNRLNVNASSFRPNPKASAFNPVMSSSNSASPKPKTDSTPATPNPFFGTRSLKKSTPVHVKDDFNPFKHNKVVEASQVSAIWPYSGKRYLQMFPPPTHPPAQHPAHMVPPIPQPMPPPSYEEDSAAQQQQQQQHRGYVYAYPQYGYPPQMMPSMPPPGPPGAYMPGPYMQPMPYPPGMPPPNGVFSVEVLFCFGTWG
ncbi:hypothetical protein CPB84DRAFT_1930138 [Gymnopilus junonius]|uniref:LsmAD domain-containing protein n=1 Tax=Gymnopilus junonius TaxID=109634 RepID=A0A9P5NY36_GYMJU|nr:hypothetical protein CPB84DRAFT_1930138 [Gymnopilus junonius]